MIGPSVHTHCLCRFLRPATGVAGQVSLSSSSDDSRFSPRCGDDAAPASFARSSEPSAAPSFDWTNVGGGSSSVEIVDEDDSMSECFNVYFSVLMSSVNGARNATFFVAGNIGFDCENVRRWLVLLGIGPLVRMDVTLKATLYGISEESESTVETDDAEFAEDDGASAAVGLSSRLCSVAAIMFVVASGDSACLKDLDPGAFTWRSSCALLKVFRCVGEVAESVSSRRLVAFLPNVEGTAAVLRESFGRFDGDGA